MRSSHLDEGKHGERKRWVEVWNRQNPAVYDTDVIKLYSIIRIIYHTKLLSTLLCCSTAATLTMRFQRQNLIIVHKLFLEIFSTRSTRV
jgi:hypothetical protein